MMRNAELRLTTCRSLNQNGRWGKLHKVSELRADPLPGAHVFQMRCVARRVGHASHAVQCASRGVA